MHDYYEIYVFIQFHVRFHQSSEENAEIRRDLISNVSRKYSKNALGFYIFEVEDFVEYFEDYQSMNITLYHLSWEGEISSIPFPEWVKKLISDLNSLGICKVVMCFSPTGSKLNLENGVLEKQILPISEKEEEIGEEEECVDLTFPENRQSKNFITLNFGITEECFLELTYNDTNLMSIDETHFFPLMNYLKRGGFVSFLEKRIAPKLLLLITDFLKTKQLCKETEGKFELGETIVNFTIEISCEDVWSAKNKEVTHITSQTIPNKLKSNSVIQNKIKKLVLIELEQQFIEWLQDRRKGEEMKDILDIKITRHNIKRISEERLYPSHYFSDLFPYDLVQPQISKNIDQTEFYRRSFDFNLFCRYLELAHDHLPLLQDLIRQILEKDYPKLNKEGWNLLELDGSEWNIFLKKIEEKAKILNTFFQFFPEIVPNFRNLFERPEDPNLDEIFEAQKNLYIVAEVFKETQLEFERTKKMIAESFNEEIWKEIAQITKQIVWRKKLLHIP